MIYGKPTKRETDVLKLFVKGYSNDEIAKELFIAKATVITHKYNLFAKYAVNTQSQLVGRYYRENLKALIAELKLKASTLPDSYFIEYIKNDFIKRLEELWTFKNE